MFKILITDPISNHGLKILENDRIKLQLFYTFLFVVYMKYQDILRNINQILL